MTVVATELFRLKRFLLARTVSAHPRVAADPPGRQIHGMRMNDMGLLDSVLGSLMGGAGGGASPIQGVLMSLLGGGQQGGVANQGAANPGLGGMMGGGLGGLMSSFENAGLGHIAQSWVGNGPNQSVSPQQLQSVFGDSQVQSMAGQAGMAPHDFLSQLSQHLPSVVSGMTPNGQMPNEGSVSV